MPAKLAGQGNKTWHLMLIVALSAIGIWLAIPLGLVIDACCHGAYCTWYNTECQRLSFSAGLIGRPEGDVVTVQRRPSSIWEYDLEDTRSKSYNYAPWAASTGMFQVQCCAGVVVGWSFTMIDAV